jgi:hypothetical protein
VFVDEINFTNTTLKSYGNSTDGLLSYLGKGHSDMYGVIPTIIFKNTVIVFKSSMSYIFRESSVEHVDLTEVTISFTTVPNNVGLSYCFHKCQNLKSIKMCQISYPTSLNQFARYCTNLESVDLSGINMEGCTDMQSFIGDCSQLKDLRLGYNLGKGYYTGYVANYYGYTVRFTKHTQLTYTSLRNIIDNVYDLNLTYGVYDEEGNPGTGTLKTQNLELGEANLAKLTPEDIAIATNKGWTVE